MMERFRRGQDGQGATGSRGATSGTVDPDSGREPEGAEGAERTSVHRPAPHDERVVGEERPVARGGVDAATMKDARRRQREEFGGINWGAAFFGWLAAAGLGAILAGLVSAAGATLALGTPENEATASNADTIGLIGGIVFLVTLLVAYFAGGYVAGRMSRFDGARQGLGVWLVALVVAIVLAVAGAVLGAEYNVLSQLNLPRIPVDEGALATGGVIALVVAILGTLLAAMAGGKAGERYHRKVDRVAIDH